jgi:small multidrug resistance family-3 protein
MKLSVLHGTAHEIFALVFGSSTLAEIAGCFSFWGWLRPGKSLLWTLPGVGSLGIFAFALTRIDAVWLRVVPTL